MRSLLASSGKLFGNVFAIFWVCSAFIFLPTSIHAQENILLFRVNAGGDAEGDWEGDTDALPSSYLLSGSANIETINGTPTLDASVPAGTPLSLFENKRIDANQPEPYMEWTFSPGVGYGLDLEVRLFFIEMSRCSPGSRVFDVEINGVIVEEDLDVYVAAGSQCKMGIMRTYTVPSAGSTLTIRFPLENGKPSIVSAIEVLGPPPFEEPPVVHFAGCPECFQGSIGDGNDAVHAGMAPYDVDFDSQGNAYIADEYNARIRVVDTTTGIINTLVDHTELKPGDAGEFDVYHPYGLVVDSADNLYIAATNYIAIGQNDTRILKRDAITGEITVFAGNGTDGYTGDGGPATDAGLGLTRDLFIDAAENLYFTDRDHHVVRKIDMSTGIIETIAGNGTQGFSGDGGLATAAQFDDPLAVAMDSQGNIYISDNLNHRIRKVDVNTGIISTFIGNGNNASSGDDGPAGSAEISEPWGIAFDAFDNLFIAEYSERKLRRVDALTNIITMLVEYPFLPNHPRNLVFEGEDLYVSVLDHAVYYYDFTGDAGTSNLAVSPLSIAFEATVPGGTSNAVEVVLTNEGTSQIAITDINITGNDPGDFSFVPNASSTIPAGSTLSFDAFFTPAQATSPQPLVTTGDPLYRINAGGDLQSDFTLDWDEDTDLNPSTYLIPGTANIETDSPLPTMDASVPAETPIDIFNTMRIDADKADPVMAWDFPVSPGEAYEVRFYFVEMSRCSVGNRVFDVAIEGTVVIDNLDVFDEAGACNIGIMRSATATSDDETMSISFQLENGKPATVAGIEIMGPDALTPIFKSAQLNIEHTGANPALAVPLSGEIDQSPGNNTPPFANFTADVDALTVSFTDTSTDSDGLVSSWSWDFGDGNLSTVQHPVHHYAAAGTYTVLLTVTDNEAGMHSYSTDIVTTDPPPNVVTLSLPDTTYALASSGLIPVWTTDVTDKDITNYNYTIAYDTTYMEVTGVDFSGTIVFGNYPASVNLTVPGEVKVSWGYVTPISGEGVMAYLEADFHTPGTSPLTFTEIEFNSGVPGDAGIDGSATVVSDTSAVTLSLPAVTQDINTAGVIPITVSDVEGKDIKSFAYTVLYDPAIVDITGADFTSSIIPADTPATWDNSTPGEITISWSGATALVGDGLFASLEIDFIATGTSPLTFSNVVFNSGIPGTILENGSATVSGGTGAFIESEGLVVMEAEHAHENNPGVDHAWEEQTDLAGFSGATYMASTPDIKRTIKPDAVDDSPELKFEVEFTTPGNYAVWARLAAPDTKGNTVHMGFEGEPHPVQSVIPIYSYNVWGWGGLWQSPDEQTFDVTTPGIHTVHVWMREDGVLIDKIILALDHDFVPTEEGPAESPRLGPAVSNASSLLKDGLVLAQEELPTEYALNGNYPNPFNPTTTIEYALPEAVSVSLVVYDMMGRKVATLVEGEKSAGRYAVQWNAQTDAGTRVASGIYLYRLRAGSFEQVRRMVLMK